MERIILWHLLHLWIRHEGIRLHALTGHLASGKLVLLLHCHLRCKLLLHGLGHHILHHVLILHLLIHLLLLLLLCMGHWVGNESMRKIQSETFTRTLLTLVIIAAIMLVQQYSYQGAANCLSHRKRRDQSHLSFMAIIMLNYHRMQIGQLI